MWRSAGALCQFDCTNTLNDQILEDVTVHVENSEGFEVIRTVPAPSLPYGKPGTTYTLVHLPEDPTQGQYAVSSLKQQQQISPMTTRESFSTKK